MTFRPGRRMAQDVFVSYSTRDQTVAERVRGELERQGFSCWMAPGSIVAGQDWTAQIVAGIRDSRAMLVVLSRHSVLSDDVFRELTIAHSAHLPVLPFRIDGTPPPDRFSYYLANTHWFTAFPGAPERFLPSLVEHLRRLLPGVAPPAEVRRANRGHSAVLGVIAAGILLGGAAGAWLLTRHDAAPVRFTMETQHPSRLPAHVTIAPPAPGPPPAVVVRMPAAPRAEAPSSEASRNAAIGFLRRYYEAMSGPAPDAIAFLENTLGDTVQFYGQTMSRARVISGERSYLAHWPQRRFAPELASAAISCDGDGATCRVAVPIDFTVHNAAKSRAGQEQVEIEITATASAPRVTAINGRTVMRQDGPA